MSIISWRGDIEAHSVGTRKLSSSGWQAGALCLLWEWKCLKGTSSADERELESKLKGLYSGSLLPERGQWKILCRQKLLGSLPLPEHSSVRGYKWDLSGHIRVLISPHPIFGRPSLRSIIPLNGWPGWLCLYQVTCHLWPQLIGTNVDIQLQSWATLFLSLEKSEWRVGAGAMGKPLPGFSWAQGRADTENYSITGKNFHKE